MKRRNWLALWLGFISSSWSGSGLTVGFGSPRFGVIVSVLLVKGFNTKYGVELSSDTGRYLMAPAELNSRGGSTAGFGGTGLPQWVEVSWREPIPSKKFIPSTGNTIDILDFGEDLGRVRVEVASRIPEDVLQYASAERGRAIKLMFRILDDAVVLGWCVQEPPKVGGGWVFSHFGGDFKPAKWFNGQVVEPGWYVDPATGQRVATTTGH